MTTGRPLERLVHRIHLLLDRDAVVTWNVKSRDPDTGQPRQIDVLIEREGKVTHVECRDYQVPQDVMWVEELIGRKDSLRADSMIGVSRSGFTGPARKKASAKGIFLRDFAELSDAEIGQWGQCSRLALNYVEFRDFTLELLLPKHVYPISGSPSFRLRGGKGDPVLLLVNMFVNKVSDQLQVGEWRRVRGYLPGAAFALGSHAVSRILIRTLARLIRKDVELASVFAYGAPKQSIFDRNAMIENWLESESPFENVTDG